MWKEFTQEKPARRGWTVATLSLAFIGTVGLAKIMVDERMNDISVVSGEQSPPDWPFDFTLPTDHCWRLRPDSYGGDGTEGLDGDTASFDGRRPSGGHCVLLVSFQSMPSGTPPEEVARELTSEDFGPSEEIAIGPINGRMTVKYSNRDGLRAMAVGCSPEGLAIVVAYVALSRAGDEAHAIRAVCKSIEFKEWRSRR